MGLHCYLLDMRLLLLFFLSCLTLYSASITGSVVGVTDGDTITVLDADKVQHKIRLYGIDAPESNQDYRQRSKQLLSALVYGDTVRVDYDGKDRYGRIVGKVYNGEQYVNAEMLRFGMAWHYKQYSKDKDLADLETTAKAGKIGLWSRPDAVAPWDFRRAPFIQKNNKSNSRMLDSIKTNDKNKDSKTLYYLSLVPGVALSIYLIAVARSLSEGSIKKKLFWLSSVVIGTVIWWAYTYSRFDGMDSITKTLIASLLFLFLEFFSVLFTSVGIFFIYSLCFAVWNEFIPFKIKCKLSRRK